MEIRPDGKYRTKQWLMYTTISFFALIGAVLIQVLVPLNPKVTAADVAMYLWPITGGAIALMWIIAVPLVILWIKNLSFYIEEDRVTIHKGILTKIQQNIPYRKVTDFRLYRSLYDRFFGIGTVHIQTAGTGMGMIEGSLAGILNWEDLHIQLRTKLQELHYPTKSSTNVQTVAETNPESGPDTLQLVLEELKGIRKALEEK